MMFPPVYVGCAVLMKKYVYYSLDDFLSFLSAKSSLFFLIALSHKGTGSKRQRGVKTALSLSDLFLSHEKGKTFIKTEPQTIRLS
jgi:hypothetical protein